MRFLLTGATGYVGRQVLRQLAIREDVEVIALTRNINKATEYQNDSRIRWFESDIAIFDKRDYKNIGKPENIIHLAWDGLPNYTQDFHLLKNLPEHQQFLRNLIEEGAGNILVSGTCLEYGLREGCLDESLTASPIVTYAKAKNDLRNYLSKLKYSYDFSMKWMRVFYVYGLNQPLSSLMGQLDSAIREGRADFDMSEGQQMRDYLHVINVAKYIVAVSVQKDVDGIINCCSGIPVRIIDFVNDYLSFHGHSLDLNLGVYPYPEYEPFKFWGSNQKLVTIVKNNA